METKEGIYAYDFMIYWQKLGLSSDTYSARTWTGISNVQNFEK